MTRSTAESNPSTWLEGVVGDGADALRSMMLRGSLVWTYAMLGEHDAALDHIDALLARPSMMSTPYLEVAPFPDALRRHPRFRRLLEGPRPGMAGAPRGAELAASTRR